MTDDERQFAAEHLRIARAASRLDAIEAVAWARCAAPSSRAALRLEIRLLIQSGEFESADTLLAQGLLRFGNDPFLLLIQAERLLERGLIDDARAVADRVLTMRPMLGRALRTIARIALNDGRPRTAVNALETAIALRSSDSDAERRLLVEACLADGDLERARWALEQFAAPPALHARVLRAEGRCADAADLLETSLGCDLSDDCADDVLAALIEALSGAGDAARLDAAIERLRPQHRAARLQASIVHVRRGHFEEAVGCARPLLSDPKWRPEALRILAVAHACLDHLDDAASAVGRLNSLAHHDAPATSRIWREALRGCLVRRRANSGEASFAHDESPLALLLQSAESIFERAEPGDREAALHLDICRAALTG